MTRIPSGRRFIALASILAFALAAGACEYSRSNRHQGGYNGSYDQHGDYNRSKDYQGDYKDNKGGYYKDNKGTCYERVREVDRYTGQTRYVDRAVPCRR